MRFWIVAGMVVCLAGAAQAQTLPSFKPGVWAGTMTEQMNTPGQPATAPDTRPVAVCSDGSDFASGLEDQMKTSPGQTVSVTQAGNVWTFSTTGPDPDGGTMTSKAVVTKSSETEFTMKGTMSSPHTDGHLAAKYHWAEPCPAGVAPGTAGSYAAGKFVPN